MKTITQSNPGQRQDKVARNRGLAGVEAKSDQDKKPLRRSIGTLVILACFAAATGGCVTSRSVQREVERVAKDWCLIIRASQVIPIYPLTEDLVPGDIFLVEQTREEQVRQYHETGFLPLDHHLARIRFGDYSNFYAGSFSLGDWAWKRDTNWMLPDRSKAHAGTNAPAKMPLAAFPSYSFQVSRSGGLKLALPIQGVNTALGLLGASSANGNVVLSEAATYGIDEASLAPTVYAWGESNQTNLAQFVPSNGPPRYLRVVNRVYLVNSVEVALTHTSETRAQARADTNPLPVGFDFASSTNSPTGVANGIDLKEKGAVSQLLNTAALQRKTTLDELNESLGSFSPAGGSVKFTVASGRAVAFSQTFPRPLVIGYIGYDIPILPGGLLGPYSSTLNVLTKKSKEIPAKPGHFTGYDRSQVYEH